MTDIAMPTRGDRRRENTKRRLTVAARSLIATHGVAGLKIRDLTETADVGKGSFYNHFASKEDLVDTVVREMLEEVAQQSADDLPDDADPAFRASVANRRFVSLAYTHPDSARLVVNLAHGDTIFNEAVSPYARAEIDRGLRSGRFEVADADMTMLILTGSAFAVMRSILDGRAPEHAAELHAESMLKLFGLGADEAREISRRSLPERPAFGG